MAPNWANDVAIASPRPEVAPVTTTRLPAIDDGAGSAGHHSLRTPDPIVE